MPTLNIKPSHKPIKNYYIELEKYAQFGEQNEGTVRAAFQNLLQHCCGQSDLTLLCEKTDYTPEKRRVTPDGEIVDTYSNQSFPFYTYDEDGTNRRENITDWALTEFRRHYSDGTITKWDIFHYTYGLLHHPTYREKYQANLKRDLPHIPTPLAPLDRGVAADFWEFANAGALLADLHVNYESQPEYSDLKFIGLTQF